ncbi:unnamed protein product [Medioppia subpectinata]|uniref:SMP-30/Gluconolactonase/LRE-like region domain-containing protein n=1 Tax=Medioppia subpectinata TaxID=1979941 RepID=A0A7R9LQ14_9ACAR|nr:unnamed protein product [Medioppia subpectinata]CAG2120709.1 unnamed protein product [Medioppia subpectinata]
MDVKSGQTEKYSFKDLVTIVIPFEDNNEDTLLVSLRNKVMKVDIKANTRQVLASIAPQLEGKERFNDGKVDAKGRLWIGSVLDGSDGAVPQKGSLYKLNGNHFIKMSEDFTLSNGMSWNLNNTKMYFNDSGDQKIYIFDFDLENGLINGMTTDKSGRLWVSLYGGGRVVQINEETGNVENFVTIPALLTTSITFGGQHLDQMYVTTGNDGQDMTQYPNAGKIFRVTSSDASFKAAPIETHFRPENQ